MDRFIMRKVAAFIVKFRYLILAILGIIMIAKPDACIKAVVTIVGAAAVVFSIYNLLFVYHN